MDETSLWLLLANAAAGFYMTGVIWFVQLVHYPQMNMVGEDGFIAYENRHTKMTTFVVAPPMIFELFSGAWVAMLPPEGVPSWGVWLNAGLIVSLWSSTFLLQVPQHTRLERGFDIRAHRFLVISNWLRTALWSARCILMCWLIANALQAL